MHYKTDKHPGVAALSLALHLLVLALLSGSLSRWTAPSAPVPPAPISLILLPTPPGEPAPPAADEPRAAAPEPPPAERPAAAEQQPAPPPMPPAVQAAPPAPSAEEWAFAARYTLKNSKGYRHNWGRQVRSMMGAAVEGPDQGAVRFRIVIAADGHLDSVETLWSTSERAEQLARQAIERLPTLPPTPTGEPLVFEKTIVFSPFAADDTPSYRDDCEPDPPVFRNPFAWDGKGPQQHRAPPVPAAVDPAALAECQKQLPQDSIEGALAEQRRQLERWGTARPPR